MKWHAGGRKEGLSPWMDTGGPQPKGDCSFHELFFLFLLSAVVDGDTDKLKEGANNVDPR